MTLTEQWKKGELESGWYYTQTGSFKEVGLDLYDKDVNDWMCNSDKDLPPFKILAKIPTYDEWVYLHKARNDAHEIVESLTKENKQLRKWCEEFNALEVAQENQRLQMSLRMTVDDYKNVVDICEQLKELLKECYRMLAQYHIENSEPSLDKNIQLLTKIDNVIGEKK